MPDIELLDLAESGRLSDPSVLGQQVQRMLDDSRSDQLIENFTEQWLHLRNISLVSPDPTEFPDFDSICAMLWLLRRNFFEKPVSREPTSSRASDRQIYFSQ